MFFIYWSLTQATSKRNHTVYTSFTQKYIFYWSQTTQRYYTLNKKQIGISYDVIILTSCNRKEIYKIVHLLMFNTTKRNNNISLASTHSCILYWSQSFKGKSGLKKQIGIRVYASHSVFNKSVPLPARRHPTVFTRLEMAYTPFLLISLQSAH